jgi:hypothetical protein
MAEDTIHERMDSRKTGKSLTVPKKAVVDTRKVGKLIRLLASDSDGEVAGAVAALGRTLLAADMSFGDLATAVETGLEKPKPPKKTKWAPPAPDTDYWESMAWWSHYHRSRLSESDRDYVHEVLLGHHFDCGRADASMMNRLRGIVRKIEAARGAEDVW